MRGKGHPEGVPVVILFLCRTKPRKDLVRVYYWWSSDGLMELSRQITGTADRFEAIHGLFTAILFPLGIHI